MKANQSKAFLLFEDFDQGEPSLFGQLTSKNPPTTTYTLSNSTYRFSSEEEDIYVLAAPKDIKAMYSMCVLADVLIVAFSLEYLSNEKNAKRFQSSTVLAYVTGVKQVITCINDPNSETELLTSELFSELSTQVHTTLRKVGVAVANILIIPISTARGSNVTAKSSDFSWYPGPSLATALQSTKLLLKKSNHDSLQMAVRDVFQRDGLVVCCGRVLRGSLQQGDSVIVRPKMKPAQVVSIGSFGNLVPNVQVGDICGVGLAGISIKDIARGTVLSSPSEVTGEVVSCTVQVIVLEYGEISWGYEALMHLGCAAVPVRIERIEKRIDRRTGAIIEEFPKQIRQGEAGILHIVPMKPFIAHKFAEIPVFGRLLISNGRKTVMVGVIKEVNSHGTQLK